MAETVASGPNVTQYFFVTLIWMLILCYKWLQECRQVAGYTMVFSYTNT